MKRSELRKIIREEYFKVLKEFNLETVRIPSSVQSYLNKFVSNIKKVNFNKYQQIAVILHILDALGITQPELSTYTPIIKKGLPKNEEHTKKLAESGVTKELDNAVVNYQRLLKQKQYLIQKAKEFLTKEKDPSNRQSFIKKHNDIIKKLNRQIEDAENKFYKAVDEIEPVEDL